MEFGIWDNDIHELPEQKKRFKSSLTSKLIPISVDRDAQTGQFNGSGKEPYNTTLNNCDCFDFIRRNMPCKHIYRLAIELGLIDTSHLDVEKGDYGTDDRTLKDRIKQYIDTLDKDSAHVLARYFYEFGNKIDHKPMRKEKIPDVVLSCDAFEDSGDMRTKLIKLKRTELLELFANTNLRVKNLTKPELVELAIQTDGIDLNAAAQLVVDLRPKELYKPVLNSLHLYIHRLYPLNRDYSYFGEITK